MDTTKGNPRISVLLPSFNSGAFLKDALDSIVVQSYKSWEVIVMDGGSTDGSLEILKEYSEMNPKIRVFSEPDESHYDAIHKALERAGGDFFYILSASDGFLDKDWFKKCMDVMEKDKTVSLVWGIPMDASEDGKILRPAYTYTHFFKESDGPGHNNKRKMHISVRILRKFKLSYVFALVKKINRWNLNTLVRIFGASMDIPQKKDWFFYWLNTGQIFPDGNMCVAKKPLSECLSLYSEGVNEPGSWMSFFFDFNSKGYLSYGLATPASFGRFHEMQNTEVVKAHDDRDRIKYFKRLKKFRQDFYRHPDGFKFIDRYGDGIL